MDRRFFNPEMSFHRHGSRAAVQVPRCGSVRWCAARRQTRIALSAGLMFASALVSHCIAEPPEKGTTENPGTILNAEGQELPTDRRAIQLLEDLSAAVTREQLPEIRDQLLRIAAFDAQLLVARSGDVWEPVYRRTFREFHRLRPGLQELLRRENKELAENELLRVAALGQTGPLIQVIHRFPGSPASYQAHLLIAQQHLDRGNRRAAVY